MIFLTNSLLCKQQPCGKNNRKQKWYKKWPPWVTFLLTRLCGQGATVFQCQGSSKILSCEWSMRFKKALLLSSHWWIFLSLFSTSIFWTFSSFSSSVLTWLAKVFIVESFTSISSLKDWILFSKISIFLSKTSLPNTSSLPLRPTVFLPASHLPLTTNQPTDQLPDSSEQLSSNGKN